MKKANNKKTMKKKDEPNHIKKWFEKTNWAKKPKAVCKPCWEIKYCPYGPLVEDFPLLEINDEKSCRIFGHHCPVFYVAEPFTETKELRNISRQIPRVTQFRVLKRENQICSVCGNSVKDGDIEFDHIIPWSKGGSSEESNIRLLCSSCNRKKGKKYEEEYLVNNVSDHLTEPSSENTIGFLLFVVQFGHDFLSENNHIPTAQDFADNLTKGDLSLAETMAAEYFKDLSDFFRNKKPVELTKEQFDALKFRWGFKDGKVYKIRELKKHLSISEDVYFLAERNLIQRLGIQMSETKAVTTKWKKL
jgi:HNH endonuclease